jgi:hypothetical protein
MEKSILFIVAKLFHQLGIKSGVLNYDIMFLMQSSKKTAELPSLIQSTWLPSTHQT